MRYRMFYDKGLAFECQRCLYCCSAEPGYVFLTQSDLSRCAKTASMTEEEFINVYCRYVDYGPYSMISLKEKANYDCIFLSDKGCRIYEGRPEQCRTYPFWKNIIESEKAWQNEAKSCPGINKGKKIKKEEIERIMKSGLKEPPIMIIKH